MRFDIGWRSVHAYCVVVESGGMWEKVVLAVVPAAIVRIPGLVSLVLLNSLLKRGADSRVSVLVENLKAARRLDDSMANHRVVNFSHGSVVALSERFEFVSYAHLAPPFCLRGFLAGLEMERPK